ncbi:hypothetical protein [Stenotrophomonas maltophilia]|uniref:hypothetical protein n=1 Tax=Stenotrophomonas maltophilia TaxID=40324 RepID=UPI0013FD93BD|nr:hypothetical protein [Stenotrophomonas maltophilia]
MSKLVIAIGIVALALCACANAGNADNEQARAAAARATVSANEAAAEAQKAIDTLKESTAELCQGESTAAERIMRARQMGTPMATVMTTAIKYGEPYVGLVHKAYGQPRLTSDAAKDVVTGEFRDTAYGDCLERWKF